MTPGFLATWGPSILSIVTVLAGGGVLKVIVDRALTRAQAGKTVVEGEVAHSADLRAWAQQAIERAEKTDKAAAERVERAERSAEESRQAAWKAEDAAARCKTQNAELSERLDTLEQWIQDCGRPGCPIKPLVVPRREE